MSTVEKSASRKLKLNSLDWDLLETMADGKRYTTEYIYKEAYDYPDYEDGWLRQRMRHLADNGLVEQLGESSMYTITDWGLTALELQDEYENHTPQDFMRLLINEADSEPDGV